MESEPTVIAIIVAITGILGWTVKLVLSWATKKIDERDHYIKDLIIGFRETINHQRTKDREALDRLTVAIDSIVAFVKNGNK